MKIISLNKKVQVLIAEIFFIKLYFETFYVESTIKFRTSHVLKNKNMSLKVILSLKKGYVSLYLANDWTEFSLIILKFHFMQLLNCYLNYYSSSGLIKEL